MLHELPFISARLKTSERLLLIPFCHHRRQWAESCKTARSRRAFLGAELVDFDRLTILTGFMGYPQLLTILAGIENWWDKRLFFLGTAGTLGDEALPDLVTVSSVIMTAELASAFGSGALDMIPLARYPARRVVTVDLPHRETSRWVQAMRSLAVDRVEMELYPLRYLYGRPFSALLVGSDRVDPAADDPGVQYPRLVQKFSEAFKGLMEHLNEE